MRTSGAGGGVVTDVEAEPRDVRGGLAVSRSAPPCDGASDDGRGRTRPRPATRPDLGPRSSSSQLALWVGYWFAARQAASGAFERPSTCPAAWRAASFACDRRVAGRLPAPSSTSPARRARLRRRGRAGCAGQPRGHRRADRWPRRSAGRAGVEARARRARSTVEAPATRTVALTAAWSAAMRSPCRSGRRRGCRAAAAELPTASSSCRRPGKTLDAACVDRRAPTGRRSPRRSRRPAGSAYQARTRRRDRPDRRLRPRPERRPTGDGDRCRPHRAGVRLVARQRPRRRRRGLAAHERQRRGRARARRLPAATGDGRGRGEPAASASRRMACSSGELTVRLPRPRRSWPALAETIQLGLGYAGQPRPGDRPCRRDHAAGARLI